MEPKTFTVTGMACSGCEENVTNALEKLEGVSRVEADHEGESVEVVASEDVSDEEIETTIQQAGYDVVA